MLVEKPLNKYYKINHHYAYVLIDKTDGEINLSGNNKDLMALIQILTSELMNREIENNAKNEK